MPSPFPLGLRLPDLLYYSGAFPFWLSSSTFNVLISPACCSWFTHLQPRWWDRLKRCELEGNLWNKKAGSDVMMWCGDQVRTRGRPELHHFSPCRTTQSWSPRPPSPAGLDGWVGLSYVWKAVKTSGKDLKFAQPNWEVTETTVTVSLEICTQSRKLVSLPQTQHWHLCSAADATAANDAESNSDECWQPQLAGSIGGEEERDV